VLWVTGRCQVLAIDWPSRLTQGSVMEMLPDFIRARLRLLAHSKLPPKRLLAILRNLAEDAAKRDE
jgi:hypothetical protein